jgi:hypothetical protein
MYSGTLDVVLPEAAPDNQITALTRPTMDCI